MTVNVERDPRSSDRWLIASVDGKPQLGAYMPGSGDINLTVYWRGQVAVAALSNVVANAEGALKKFPDDAQGTLIAYGETRKRVGPVFGVSSILATKFSIGFDAYRAELESKAGRVIIWANVATSNLVEFEDGSENIGVCVTPALFNGSARPVYELAILKTTNLSWQTITQLLDEISKAMLPRRSAS
jgi:hypothetical protein